MSDREPHGRRWTDEEILSFIRRWVTEHGEPPFAEDWKRAGPWPTYRTLCRRFGSWSNAMKTAGVKVRRRGDFKIVDGRRPQFDSRFLVAWQRRCAERDISDLHAAYQKALMDPQLRSEVIGQMRDDRSRYFPQNFREDRTIPTSELQFETPIEDDFANWLVPVMDWRREIDAWADAS